MGQISSFNIYHLMTVDSPSEAFPFCRHVSEGPGSPGGKVDKRLGPGAVESTKGSKARTSVDPTRPSTGSSDPFEFAPNQLAALASIIRSKNSGPFEVTFDVIFSKQSDYDRVKNSDILTRGSIALLYSLDEADVVTAMWWPQALAFKTTVVRSAVSGGWGEVDMHSSTQHVRLMYLEIPNTATTRSVQRASSMMCTMHWVGIPKLRISAFLAACSVVTIFYRYRGLMRKGLKS